MKFRFTKVLTLAALLSLGASPLKAQTNSPTKSATRAVVAADGSGDYKTVQEAIAAAPDNSSNVFAILIKPGTYEGQFVVPPTKRNIRLVGEKANETVLSFPFNVFETNDPRYDSRFKRQDGIGFVVLGNDFSAENITFENRSGDHGQALALRVIADRAVFKNCRMLGWQDTLRLDDNRQYLTNCYIEGRVDFIYGSGSAVFDHCEIHSKNGGYATAANTPKEKPFGFVFLNCKLTGDPTPWMNPTNSVSTNAVAAANTSTNGAASTNNAPRKVMAYLGRPWRGYASVAYLNCWMGDHIRPEGWDNWRNPTNELTARYVEFNSSGPGANPDKRVKWAKQLTSDEAAKITIESVLSGNDNWNPTK